MKLSINICLFVYLAQKLYPHDVLLISLDFTFLYHFFKFIHIIIKCQYACIIIKYIIPFFPNKILIFLFLIFLIILSILSKQSYFSTSYISVELIIYFFVSHYINRIIYDVSF